MLLRKALLAALVVAPFVYSPAAVSAQSGLERAAVASAKADEVGAAQNSHANQDMPPGLANHFDGQLPPGIARTRGEAVAPSNETDDGTADDGSGGDGGDTGTTEVCLAYETVWSGFSSTQVCVLWGTP